MEWCQFGQGKAWSGVTGAVNRGGAGVPAFLWRAQGKGGREDKERAPELLRSVQGFRLEGAEKIFPA